MESKTLHNLSSSYKKFLSNTNSLPEFNNINEKSSLSAVNNVYNAIDIILKDVNLQIADINHMMTNYEKHNAIIDKIKQISSLRNYLIINLAIKHTTLKPIIVQLKKHHNICSKTAHDKILSLFQQYIGTWNTIDKYFIMNDTKTRIMKIDIIDPDDIEFLYNLN